jgi:hypothetical protein
MLTYCIYGYVNTLSIWCMVALTHCVFGYVNTQYTYMVTLTHCVYDYVNTECI